jgi:hypothetical protein
MAPLTEKGPQSRAPSGYPSDRVIRLVNRTAAGSRIRLWAGATLAAAGVVAAIAGALTLASSPHPPLARLHGVVWSCSNAFGHPCAGGPSSNPVLLQFKREGLFGGTFKAYTRDGEFSLFLPPGGYQVTIQGCKRFPASGRGGEYAPPVIYAPDDSEGWLIYPSGECEMAPRAQ